MFCRSLFVLLCFFFWPLFFFDIRILIAPFGTSKLFLNILLITHSFLTLLSLTHRLNDKIFKCNKKGKKIYHTVRTVQKYITLSEQFKNISHCQNSSKIYHTVRTVQKYITLSEQFNNISHCQNSSKIYHTVRTVQKYITLSEQFKNISHCQNSSKIYHTVRTVQIYITLSEQFKNISHCQNSSKIYHTVRTVQQSNRNIIETEEKSLTLSSCYGYFSSTVKLVLLVQTSPAK